MTPQATLVPIDICDLVSRRLPNPIDGYRHVGTPATRESQKTDFAGVFRFRWVPQSTIKLRFELIEGSSRAPA